VPAPRTSPQAAFFIIRHFFTLPLCSSPPYPLRYCLLCVFSSGCGGGASQAVVPPPAPTADFSLTLSSNSGSVAQGATSSPINVSTGESPTDIAMSADGTTFAAIVGAATEIRSADLTLMATRPPAS
jgi:hypothetical protein